jgi:hypothetical protein
VTGSPVDCGATVRPSSKFCFFLPANRIFTSHYDPGSRLVTVSPPAVSHRPASFFLRRPQLRNMAAAAPHPRAPCWSLTASILDPVRTGSATCQILESARDQFPLHLLNAFAFDVAALRDSHRLSLSCTLPRLTSAQPRLTSSPVYFKHHGPVTQDAGPTVQVPL